MKTKNGLGFFTICAILWLSMPSGLAAEASYAAQIQMKPVFTSPIQWVGKQEPPEAESLALLNAIRAFGTNDVNAGFAALEDFIATHPQSAWVPSLRVNLAEYYGKQGRFTLALAQYEAAWTTAKNSTDPAGQMLAARNAAGLASLLADLGQKDQLESLLDEVEKSKIPLGVYSTPVSAARQQFQTMKFFPGDAYKCGLVALNDLAGALHIDSPLKRYLPSTASPEGGFTLAQLLVMARTNGIPLEAVRRPAGAELVVPCIMHWKFNHYALVTKAQGGRYQVANPVSGAFVYMTVSAIDAESSGVFLVPRDQAPVAWQKIPPSECDRIRGGCYGGPPDDEDDDSPDCDSGDEGSCSDPCNPPSPNDGASGDGGGCPPADDPGMAQWRVSEPYISLWLQDTPLRYRLSTGEWMPLKLSYKQRGEYKGPNVGCFGPNWECNWIGILEQPSPNTYVNHLAGGGVRSFVVGVPDYKSARMLTIATSASGNIASEGGNLSANGSGGSVSVPVINSPTGSQNRYAYAYTFGSGVQYNFLTRRVDRYGRYIQYNYVTSGNFVELTSIVDKDGRTISLAYNDSVHPNFITSITDPYNRTCTFTYDDQADNGQGLLTNIVDTIGMSSSFKYDGNNLITNLTTPYGQTGFQSVEGTNSIPSQNRSLLVTEANGEYQLYAYCSQGPGGDYPIGDGESNFRNSYHWNRAQYDTAGIQGYLGAPPVLQNLLNLPGATYYDAEIKHWLHNSTSDGGAPVCDTLGAMAGPVDPLLSSPGYNVRSGALAYRYYGQTYIAGIGTLKRVTGVWNPTYGSVQYLAIQRNSLGRPTQITHYNSDGSSATYNNIFDTNGMYLQQEWGPRGERTRGYGYNNTNFPNLLTSVTNAVGDVIRYTHDPATLKVTSITFPGGLVRTNIYYASGPSQGFLQMQADLGIRTNYFTYVNGNLALQTNELGLVTSNAWDNLNRLISTAYPDSTTVSNLYDKLDTVGEKDRLNQWTYYGYNEVRQLTNVTNANGQITQYDYCGCGSPDLITRWLGGRAINTSLAYDIAGRLTNTAYADGYQINRTYDENNQLQTISDTGGRNLQLAYAQHGLKFDLATASMISLQSQPRLLLTQKFDEYGRVTNSVDRNAVTVTNGYDFLDRLVARQAFGNSGAQKTGLEKFVYNALGLTNYFDPLAHLTTYVRDAAGRVLYETNANLEVLQFDYNPSDELQTLIDGKNQTTHWNYDPYGRVTNKVDNTSVEMFRYQYDSNDRLTNRWQAGNVVTAYKYDPIGNLTNVTYPGSGVMNTYQYDDLNRLTSMVDAIGATVFVWNDGDQLAVENGPWAYDSVVYTYNNRLRDSLWLWPPGAAAWSQTYQYDEFMRLKQVVSPAGTFGYQYASLTLPGGAATVPDLVQQLTYPNNAYSQRGYDHLGRLTLTRLTDATGAVVFDQHGYQYDPASQRTVQTFAAGNFQYYTYDNIGQLKTANGFEANGTARPQEQFGYGYDAAWNLNQRINGSLVQNFSVNSLNELSTASRPPNATITVSGSYEYGNPPVSVTVSGTGLPTGPATVYADKTWAKTGANPADGANTYTANATDNSAQVSQDTVNVYLPVNNTYQYDARGNLTNDGRRSFAYDDENQLTSVWVTNVWRSDFVYDGMLRRRIETNYTWSSGAWLQTNEVLYVYDGELVIQERDANNAPQVTYTRGNDLSGGLQGAGGIGGLLARTDMGLWTANSGLATAFYHADGNGNVTCLFYTNNMVQALYSYDPYGNMLAMSGPLANVNAYRFSSKEWSGNAGLYYYGFRFYDPNLQRWLNRDPLGEQGGVNLYNFVGSAPINLIDPHGECTIPYPLMVTSESAGPWGWAALGLLATGVAAYEIATLPPAQPAPPPPVVYSPPVAGNVNAPPTSISTPMSKLRPSATMPAQGGPPSGTLAEDRGNGKGTIRTYGPDGRAKTDYDIGHDHGQGDPHAHDWDWSNPEPRGPARPLCPGE